MTADEVRVLVDEVLREMLGADGFARAQITERPDESGEAGLYIDVHFRPGATASEERPMFSVIGELRWRLLGRDEERLPYLHYVFADDEILLGESVAAAE